MSSSLLFSTHSRTASATDSVFYDFITQAPSASWAEAKIEIAALAEWPDLIVSKIECGPGNKLSVTIKNIGSGTLPSGWQAIAEAYFNQIKKGTFGLKYPTSTTGGGIEEPGGSSTYLIAWDITAPVIVMVIVDSTNSITESNEQNNYKEEIIEPLLPDLIVSKIECSPSNKLLVTIKNIGSTDLPDGWAAVAETYFDGVEKGFFGLTYPISTSGGGIEKAGGSSTYLVAYDITAPVTVRVIADSTNAITESNETNNSKEEEIEPLVTDITPPQVTVTYSPSDVTISSEVMFTVRARDESSITEIMLFINGAQVKKCAPPNQGVDEKDRVYWECVYTGGPYEPGELNYWAEAVDEYGNGGTSPEGTINVALVLELCWFSISGTIHNFPYSDETLKIEVCEAETITYTPGPEGTPLTLTQCKEGGGVWYADVARRMEGDLPGPDLYYYIGGLCPGEYIVELVFNPAAWCEWQGNWETAKGRLVTIEDSSAEGFDFTFTPLDTHSPEISLFQVEPEQPEYNEEITVTILANDDREIVSIWEKTDLLGLDGSYRSGYWSSLTVVPGLEGSTAGAQFSSILTNVMTATITVRVCDIGGNSRLASKVITCGSCSDKIQNQGETGIDCGGPCPSQCVECLTDHTKGSAPSAYLYSLEDVIVLSTANDACFEYANEVGISILDLDTADDFIRTVTWWIPRHMGYRGDDVNRTCINELLPSPYDPADYGHGDFPVPAAYTLRYSGEGYITDPTKDYFGDCEDFAILESAMLRSMGVCHNCIFNADQPGHGFNIVYYEGKYRVLEPQAEVLAIGCEDYGPEFIWNDKVGAMNGSEFEKVRPWEYTMNYPYCEHPTVTVSGGGFGSKEFWLDWDGWAEHCKVAVGDFDDDGRDDIAAVWYEGGYMPYQASVLFSTGSSFQTPSEGLGWGGGVDFTPLVVRGSGKDYIVAPAPADNVLCCVQGTPYTGLTSGHVYHFYRDDPVTGVVGLGDPDGDRWPDVIELHKDTGEVYVNGHLWNSDFSPGEEIPCVGDFDGDGYVDVVSFERGSWGGVRVIRAVPDQNKFTMFCLWHDEFCLDEETPMVGDFNGDGRDDIVAFNLDNKDVFVGLSTIFGFWSNGFSETQSCWHYDFCSEDNTPLVGDFNGDGLDDIACFHLDDGRARVWVSLAEPSTMTYDFHGGCLCEQAHFYLDAYSPSICP